MSAGKVLLEASTRIHHDIDFGQQHGDPVFLAAVAAWLDATEDSGSVPCECGLTGDDPLCEHEAALAVARAYLGGES